MNYIERNPAKCFSMPSLVGRRLTVFDIVTLVDGDDLKSVLEDFQLTPDQAVSAINYCRTLSCQVDADQYQFCDGCILRSIADGDTFDSNDYYEEINEHGTLTTFSKDGISVYPGSIEAFEREALGIETWKIASGLLDKYWP